MRSNRSNKAISHALASYARFLRESRRNDDWYLLQDTEARLDPTHAQRRAIDDQISLSVRHISSDDDLSY